MRLMKCVLRCAATMRTCRRAELGLGNGVELFGEGGVGVFEAEWVSHAGRNNSRVRVNSKYEGSLLTSMRK